jgi:anthraniloyl-CoA monooxygenase
MKIAVIGGGPGGLYFALLTKKARPDWTIEVFEQNAADDTFGFGVVFSDESLDEFLTRDPISYEMIRDSFAYWDDIIVRHRDVDIRCGGNGFAGCSRLKLLQILQARCRSVGVGLHFRATITGLADFDSYDAVIAADGVNSRIRDLMKDEFRPQISFKANKFAWFGSTREMEAFTYFFKETDHGVICAHTYQYEPGRSTWVIEMSPACWQGHGFDALDDQASARKLEAMFADELQGHPLLTNRSLWRNFPRIFCERWHAGKVALLGDAKASAHFSIGSGTKLAMECAIALSDAMVAHGAHSVEAAYQAYDAARRTPVQITQHNADVSLAWFEHMERNIDMSPMRFAMVVMCRAKSITWDNLMVRDADFVSAFEDVWYEDYLADTGVDVRKARPTPMFTPLRLRDLTLQNRVVVSPMAQYLAEDGVPGDWHFQHYAARAAGGAGLVYVEMTCPSPDARITLGCPGLWNDAQEAGWKRIVDFAHAHTGAKMCMQLGHAGRKGSTQLGWEKMDHPIADEAANWPLVSASPLPYFKDISQVPAALDEAGMTAITADFVQAAQRADRAGFDMLELHCAHGYLLASFLSPLTNHRADAYGGSVENRLRFPLRVFEAMRAVWPAHKPMSVRISASDWAEGGVTEEDTVAWARAFAAAGCDLIDVSAGQTVPDQKPVYGRMFQVQFAEAIRNITGLRTMAVGAVTEASQINTIIACRRADLVAVGRPHLVNPFFTAQAAAWYAARGQKMPKAYASGVAQAFRDAEKDRQKQMDLQRKAKPKRHARVAPLLAAE